jgi:hypothetical protein
MGSTKAVHSEQIPILEPPTCIRMTHLILTALAILDYLVKTTGYSATKKQSTRPLLVAEVFQNALPEDLSTHLD